MKAIQIVDLSGPDSALREADVPEPEASHMLTPGSGVLVDVAAAGVSFPEVLQTRGEYQVKPPLPFVPGSEVAGTVRSAPDVSALEPVYFELYESSPFSWGEGVVLVRVEPTSMWSYSFRPEAFPE